MPDLAAHYADYYPEPIRRWRALGAIDKAANVARLWPDGADIGRLAGPRLREGSVIQRLGELGYGERVAEQVRGQQVESVAAVALERAFEAQSDDHRGGDRES